jgi:hypothetical protein
MKLSSTSSTHSDLLPGYQKLQAALTRIGYFRRGSVGSRMIRCGRPDCHCNASPPLLHGPYYAWTRKVNGKTVTVYLYEEQAKLMQEWIENGRRMDRIIARMQQLALRETEKMLGELPADNRKKARNRRRAGS